MGIDPQAEITANKIGAKIRSLRERQNLTQVALARKAGVSTGFLSQLEKGTNQASVETLRRIAQALNVPLFFFFIDEDASLSVVRRDQRKELVHPKSEARYELLTPDLNRQMELVLITLEPGQPSFQEAFSHSGEEVNFVLEGEVRFEIGDRCEVLKEGDSIYFDCAIPHRFVNIGQGRARILSAVTPPTF